VLREDHHNCDDNAQTDEVFRKAASALFFLHIRSSMQAHGEIRYDTRIVPAVFMKTTAGCRVGTATGLSHLDVDDGSGLSPASQISKL
jgi:hypothetical protein